MTPDERRFLLRARVATELTRVLLMILPAYRQAPRTPAPPREIIEAIAVDLDEVQVEEFRWMWGVVYLAETLEGASLLRTLIGGGRTRALIRDEDQLRARIPDLLARLVACRHLLASVVADEHGASLRDRLVAELDRALGPGVYEPEEGLEELIDHLVDLRHQTDEVPSPILETGSLEPRIYRPHPFVARADILASLLGATTVHGRVLDQALKSYDEVATFFGE